MDDILKRVQEIFRDIFDEDELVLTAATTAADIEEWDSLNHINLVNAIEKEFKIRFALGELQLMKNVGEMIHLISVKTS